MFARKVDVMTKLERAIKEAEKLPDDLRDQLGEELLHFVHKYLALQDEIALGVAQLDRGETVSGDVVLAKLKARYGA